MSNRKIGRYLGSSIKVGDTMCGMMMTETGQVLHRTSIMPLKIE